MDPLETAHIVALNQFESFSYSLHLRESLGSSSTDPNVSAAYGLDDTSDRTHQEQLNHLNWQSSTPTHQPMQNCRLHSETKSREDPGVRIPND
ncbi:MAG: hypothetical protein DME18_12825 [Verrucomicrobia bacterium]|nr:MAG: hypothetical protein DME18_12825 [Verrucomicrobiota bacterium]